MASNVSDYTNYTVNVPHQAAWLVYINGLEIPVVDIELSFGVWNIPEATLQLIPHVILQRIGFEDRLQVQIFYLDEFFDPNNPEFRLFHEYEVTGWAYTNAGTGRFIQLNCRSHVQIMEQLYFYYMSAVDDMVVANSPATATDAGVISDSMIYYPYSLFLQGLVRPVATAPGAIEETVSPEEFVKSPFEFISNVFRALLAPIDVSAAASTAEAGKIPANAASCPGRNFFGRWINMTDFRRRWAGIPFFDSPDAKSQDGCFPLIKAVQSTEVLSAIQEQIGQSIGHAGSMWELLKTVFGVMYLEVNAVPAPPAVKLEKGTGLLKGPIDSGSSGTVRNGPSTFGGILSNYVKPQCIFGIPPTCNIIFPSMITNFTFQENYMNQPTRIYLGEQFMTNVLTAQASGAVQALAKEAVTTGYPPVVQNRMRLYITDPKQNTKNFLIYPEELYKGPVSTRLNAPPWLYMLSKMQDNTLPTTRGVVRSGGVSVRVRGRGEKRVANTKAIIDPIVKKYASKYSLPVKFIYAVIRAESGYKFGSISDTGAGGLMQVMPTTASFLWGLIKTQEGGVPAFKTINTLDPEHNIHMGTFYLRRILDEFGYPNSAIKLSALGPDDDNVTPLEIVLYYYNAGPKWGRNLKSVVDKQEAAFKRLKKPAGTPNTAGKNRPQHKKYGRFVRNAWRIENTFNTKPDPTPAEEVAIAAKPEANTPESTQTEQTDNTPQTAKGSKPTSNTTTEAEVDIDQLAISKLGELFNIYARYEFYRKRFEHRTGGVTLSFNPYILPGYPAVVFDEKSSGFDIIGYVTNVHHKMSAAQSGAQMVTTVSMSYTRSFPEFIKYLKQGFEESGEVGSYDAFDCGPSEPLEAVGNAFQKKDNADSFYGQMFYPGVTKSFAPGWSPAFNWKKMIEVYRADGKTKIDKRENYNYELGLVTRPTRQYTKEFRSYDAAMAYVARPACTLRQYIELRHGEPLDKMLTARTKVRGMNTSYFSYTRAKGRGKADGGATFWARIDAYIQGPGNPATEIIQKVTNVGPAPEYAPNASGSWDILTGQSGVPQTRRDWDKMLQLYRSVVRGEKGHVAPQL
jgi:hypothetical protein